MSTCSINVKKIAKKYIDKKQRLSDLERIALLYTYYNEMLESIDEEEESDLDLQEQIIEEWVVNLFVPSADDIDLEIAALSILGSS